MARALLESKKFAVRAVTRNVTQPKALVLQELGAEVVKGDLNDKTLVESALKDAYGVFLVTNYWEHHSKDEEVCQVGILLSSFLLPFLVALSSLEGGGP